MLIGFIDTLFLAWVSLRYTADSVFPEKGTINAKQVASIAFNSVLIDAGRDGFGHHVWDLPEIQRIDLDRVSR